MFVHYLEENICVYRTYMYIVISALYFFGLRILVLLSVNLGDATPALAGYTFYDKGPGVTDFWVYQHGQLDLESPLIYPYYGPRGEFSGLMVHSGRV